MEQQKENNQVSVFRYDDYRKFLKDWYAEAKKTRGSFSFRAFSKRAGFTSPNYLKMVMDGDRNLTEESLPLFVKGLKLNKQEQEFFRNLVLFNQARTHEQKDFYYKRLIQSKKLHQIKPIQKEHYEYCSTWYHAVIREMVIMKEFDGTISWIENRIHPKLSSAQIEKSLEVLEKLGFIEKNKQEKWQQATPLMTTGAEVSSLVLMNYHLSLLELAKEKLLSIPPDQRDVSSMTLGISQESLPALKKKIADFRKEIMKYISLDHHPDTVVQMNIQLYPMIHESKG